MVRSSLQRLVVPKRHFLRVNSRCVTGMPSACGSACTVDLTVVDPSVACGTHQQIWLRRRCICDRPVIVYWMTAGTAMQAVVTGVTSTLKIRLLAKLWPVLVGFSSFVRIPPYR